MRKIIKQMLCFILVLTCIFTSVPTTAYASFSTDSSKTSGGGKTYKGLKNIVNVGYRISLYYCGKPDNSGKRYMPLIAHNEKDGKKPMMNRFSDTFSSNNYIASKYMGGNVTATYFRDIAATNASILVLSDKGNKFDTIYQLIPTVDYKDTKMDWNEVENLCKKGSKNKVYTLLNDWTDGELSDFQSRTWIATKSGASGIVKPEKLDKIDTVLNKDKSKKEDLIKAFKNYSTKSYYDMCINDSDNVYLQIEPVAILSGVKYDKSKGFLTTWSEAKMACNGTKNINTSTTRGVFSWRVSRLPGARPLMKVTKIKTLTKDDENKYKVYYYSKTYESSTDRGYAAMSILGTLYNSEIWGKSTQLTSGFNSCSGIAYYAASIDDTPTYEDVESISILYTGELNEESMKIENGKWTQANALAVYHIKDSNDNKLFGTPKTSDMELAQYINYVNKNISKKFSQNLYTYAKGTGYEKEKTNAIGTVGYSTNSNTEGYNLVAFYQYLINNKKANVKTSTLAKRYNNATENLIAEQDSNGGSALKASWLRNAVGSGSDGLNAGYTVAYKGIEYDDGTNKYSTMYKIIDNKIVSNVYDGLNASYKMGRILEYPYYKEAPDGYTLEKISSKKANDNALATADDIDVNVLIRSSKYAGSVGKGIATNVLALSGSKDSLATQAYYLEGTAFRGLLGNTVTTMTKLNKINKNRKYALDVLVAAKIADVKSYYTWATYDFTNNKIASSGTTSKTYDITSYGTFPLGENGQKGLKRVIIVPNQGAEKNKTDMAISQSELENIVESGCVNATEDASEKEILESIWTKLRNKLADNASEYQGTIREHYLQLLDQYADEEMYKHNGSETACVGYYQNKEVEVDTEDEDNIIEEESPDYVETEVDESENPEDEGETDEYQNGSGSEETTESTYDKTKYANSIFENYEVTLTEKEFMEKMNELLKSKGVDYILYESEDTEKENQYKVGNKLDNIFNLISILDNGTFVLIDKNYNEIIVFNDLIALFKLIIPNYKEPELDNTDESEYFNSDETQEEEINEDNIEGVEDTGKDIENTIVNSPKAKQRGYTIIGIGYTGKRTKAKGVDLQAWELNYVYADLQAALMASNEDKVNDTIVSYNTNAYVATKSSDSSTDLHSKAKIWSYTGNRNECTDGHTSLTALTHKQDHYGRTSWATVDYVPSAVAWDKDDTLFSYNIILSDETKERSSSIDDVKNSNYTYSVNKNKLHADEDDDESANHYSLVLYSNPIMNSMWSTANNTLVEGSGYNNTSIRWGTWSRISKNFNNSSNYKNHYFTVNTMRESAYLSYVYNLIRYISGDERVVSSIYNYLADENNNPDIKGDSYITDFLKDCLLMKTDNLPNLEVAHITQSSDKVQKRNRKNKFNLPYYQGKNAQNFISEHITLNAYMQDDDDTIHYSDINRNCADIKIYNMYGYSGDIYHTYKTLSSNGTHNLSKATETIQWTHNVSTTITAISKEHCHKVTGSWHHWVSTKYGGYWCSHSYDTDLSDVPTLCYHERNISGVMPCVFLVRRVNQDTGKLEAEEEDSQYTVDYSETIYKYVTESMDMGENNTNTGIIDTNGEIQNSDKADLSVNSSKAGEKVESKTPNQDGNNNSKITTNFASAFFDSQKNDSMAKTAFGFYPEVNMLAYQYGRGQKLGDTTSVTPYVVPTMGEIARASKGAGLYFMTTKNSNNDYAVDKNLNSVANKEKKGDSDFVGTTYSDSVATSSKANELGNNMRNSLYNSNKDIRQVIYAGSDVTITGDANFGLNLYGYELDLIKQGDTLTVAVPETDKYSTMTNSYDYIVADNSNIYQKWYDTIKGTYKDIISANADMIRRSEDNAKVMSDRYQTWVKQTTDLSNWYADYTLKSHGTGADAYNSKFTDFSATIGSLKTADNKVATDDGVTKQTDVYPLHFKNGEIIRTDAGYVALMNQIAIDYFGDTANNVVGTVVLTNGKSTAKLEHYEDAEELFKNSSMGSSVLNAIESSNSDFNKSGSCFTDGDARGVSSIGSTQNWYDEEVRTIVVRRFKTDTLYFKNITASDKIDYNIAPTSETMTDNWTGRAMDWYLNISYKDTVKDNFGVTTSQVLGSGDTSIVKEFQVVKDLYVDNASFIVPSATTDNMGW